MSTPDRPARPKKTALLIAQRLVSEIEDGGLEPGVVLPPEREMLARYGVARGSLREALRYLEMQGVVTMRPGPGGGPIVSTPGPQHLASTLGLLLELSGAVFRVIPEGRLILEPPLCAIAAEQASDEVIEQIAEAAARMRADVGDMGAFFHENSRFHSLIAWASDNPLFGHLISSLRWITDGTSLGVDYSVRRRLAICAAHDKIVAALLARDPEAARTAMHEHMVEALAYLERRYPEVLSQRLRWDQIVV